MREKPARRVPGVMKQEAKMPTTVPSEVQELLDNGLLLIGAIGTATLVVILGISAWKYVRGVA